VRLGRFFFAYTLAHPPLPVSCAFNGFPPTSPQLNTNFSIKRTCTSRRLFSVLHFFFFFDVSFLGFPLRAPPPLWPRLRHCVPVSPKYLFRESFDFFARRKPGLAGCYPALRRIFFQTSSFCRSSLCFRFGCRPPGPFWNPGEKLLTKQFCRTSPEWSLFFVTQASWGRKRRWKGEVPPPSFFPGLSLSPGNSWKLISGSGGPTYFVAVVWVMVFHTHCAFTFVFIPSLGTILCGSWTQMDEQS